jgi:serine/threonine-protein kinase
VPGLVGQTEVEAGRRLQQAGLGVSVREDRNPDAQNGIVRGQDPPPGTRVEPGARVTITVGRPQAAPKPKPKTPERGSPVPNVEGMDRNEASRTLQSAGFKVTVEEEGAPDRKGQVVNQIPGAGDTVEPGATVTIYIGV